MYAYKKFKEEVKKALEKATGKSISETSLSIPPDPKLGDLSTSIAFALAKEQNKNPSELAKEISSKIKPEGFIKEVKIAGPYINFYLDYEKFSGQVLEESFKEDYGKSDIGKGKQVMIEYCGVNPNKPHHMGHFRNESLGQSIANIHKHLSYDVISASIVNDKGVPVAKTILGYQKFRKGKAIDNEPYQKFGKGKAIDNEPYQKFGKEKSDHEMGWLYSKYETEIEKTPELKKKVQEMVQKIQSGDPEALKDWKKVWDWFFEGMGETHKREKVHIDKFYYESKIQAKGKELVKQGLEKGVFKTEKEAIVAPLEKYGIPDKILLRSDGTAVYATTDIGMVHTRFTDYPNLEKNIYCVMTEQKTYFQQWMKAFELLYPEHAGKSYHMNYGMVSLKGGGKMSSRKGKGVLSDDIMNEAAKLAEGITKKNNPSLKDEEIKQIAEAIGIGALKFSILSIEAHKDISFDIKKAVSFEGDTGPYLQYAYVRCNGILEKVGGVGKPNVSQLKKPEELELIKKIAKFPEIVKEAGVNYETHTLAHYLLDIVHTFSNFYEKCPVMKAENEGLKAARAGLVKATKNVLKIGLNLLGIDTPERM